MIKATKEVKTVKEVQRRDGKSDKSLSRCRLERERWNSTSSSTSLKVQWSSSFLTAARSHRWVKLKSTILVLFSYPDLIWDSDELNISPTYQPFTGEQEATSYQHSRGAEEASGHIKGEPLLTNIYPRWKYLRKLLYRGPIQIRFQFKLSI